MNSFKQELAKKLLIGLLIIAVLLGGLIFLSRDIDKRAQGIRKQRQQLADRSEELNLFAKLQGQSAKAEPYLGVLENVLPGRDQLFDFSREMERLASQEEVGFGFTFRGETPATAAQPGRIEFTMSVEGPFPKVFKFIKAMEESRFLINFKNFDFTGSAMNISGEVLFH